MTQKDEIFKREPPPLTGFQFNRQVADVFDDMLLRSIPLYAELQGMMVDYTARFAQNGTSVVDIGCSTGHFLSRAMSMTRASDIDWLGIDSSQAMIDKARETLGTRDRLNLICGDVFEVPLAPSSVLVMSFTLQFIRPMRRAALMEKLFQALLPGGVLLLAEKVVEAHQSMTRLFADMHFHFKQLQGYSQLEIAAKRDRLENVLVPFEVDENLTLLSEAGFEACSCFFKWNNFAAMIARKTEESS